MSSPQVVTSWNTKDWNKDDGTTVKVTNVRFGTGEEIPGYDIPVDLLKENAPLPEGWTIAESKAGKPYVKVPKPRSNGGGFGGPAAFRNTKEGQQAEQVSIHRSVALTQAVAALPGAKVGAILSAADSFYDWLRLTASVPAGASASQPAASPPAGASSSTPAPIAGTKAESKWEAKIASPPVVEAAGGEGVIGEEAPSPSDCAHEHTSPLSPGGKPLKTGLRCLDCGLVVPT